MLVSAAEFTSMKRFHRRSSSGRRALWTVQALHLVKEINFENLIAWGVMKCGVKYPGLRQLQYTSARDHQRLSAEMLQALSRSLS